jgi:ABC-2 type transport system ATP-binding protein
MSLLQAHDLTKTFASKQAVKSINFEIKEGRCITLLGPNGAGKTTTLRMLSGLLTPTSGSIKLSGLAEGVDIRTVIGYLPQYPAFYTWMTGREYLNYVGRLSKLDKKLSQQRADEMLIKVGLTDARNRRISGYSGGMKQRLGLAQAMMHQPKLVILDEPVSALDPLGRREVLDMMREMKKETTIMFSTHVLPDAEEISDDILIMRDGEIVIAGELNTVMDEHRQPIIRLRGEESLEKWQVAFTKLDGVQQVDCHGEYAEIRVSDRDLSRTAIMQLLAQENIAIRKLEIAQLSLEDLFMKAVNI